MLGKLSVSGSPFPESFADLPAKAGKPTANSGKNKTYSDSVVKEGPVHRIMISSQVRISSL